METYINLKEKINEEKLKIIGKEIKNGNVISASKIFLENTGNLFTIYKKFDIT